MNRVVQRSLVALPLFDRDGLLFALIYGVRENRRIALRVASAELTRRGRLKISDADWRLAARRWESGDY